MRSYAGMVENAMGNAEARAKQVGTALARDTAGQAQAALQQIERLRDEAQAHTQRAVGDLKSSFETVITQIGRQLEQMRGQFDNTSRGMRETAQKTASDLDSLRQEMQKRMEGLPEHTAQATAAIRKALSEQLREIEAITAPALARPAAPPQAPAPDPFRQGAAQPRPQSFQATPAQFNVGPLPHFDARGRPVGSPDGDIGQVAGGLASQLSNAAIRRSRNMLARTSACAGRLRHNLRRKAADSSVSTRLPAPSTTAPRPTCGSASGPVSAACSAGISTPSRDRQPSTRWFAATIARPISA